jgi:uncharacterized damage-inducible protein DinB
METTKAIAQSLKEVYFGGNWTAVNFLSTLDGITLQQATFKVDNCNTIATLVYHTSYYIEAILQVLKGGPLQAKDADSFICPTFHTEADWKTMVASTFDRAYELVASVNALPNEILFTTFVHEKYGTYYRNLQGIIEHLHYHLGQINLLKKMVQSSLSQ